ncbi:MAG: MBL fold metallo-hydrolase [Dehalococcoidia bacterium]
MKLDAYVVGRIQANCYVIGDDTSGDVLVIDPGDQVPALLDQIRSRGQRVVAVAVTHHHLDHSGGTHELLEAVPEAQFYMHALDYPQIEASAPSAPTWYGHAIEPPRPPDVFLEDGDSFEVGSLRFEALHCPGHTPGSLCYLVKSEEGEPIVFTGDVLFAGSIGRTDFPGGSHPQLIESIQTKLLTLPDETIVLPGHMGASTVERERASNPFLQGG